MEGVSRSGRVRKKSSKLTDFESIDETDRQRKKNEKNEPYSPPSISSTSRASGSQKKTPIKMETNSDEEDIHMPPNFTIKEEAPYSGSDTDVGAFHPNDSSLDSLGSEVDDDETEDQLVLDHPDSSSAADSFQRINTDSPDPSTHTQAQSLYMLEKSTKKKLIIKDGRIVGRAKAQRKDKGKTRFTAYMLWAKEIRQELMRANPELDFSQTSKRLGELWATVPYNEKYIWKRKAKRLASKGEVKDKPSTAAPSPKKKPTPRKFINKQSGQADKAQAGSSSTVTSPDPPSSRGGGRASLVAEPVVGPGMYKVVGTQPIDVSAHLRLLGESLTIIGERLKEHEGQIAVSGSLSVLLDSLLCALGPLLCLTQQIPETSTACAPETLSKILDNIAYIMPGL